MIKKLIFFIFSYILLFSSAYASDEIQLNNIPKEFETIQSSVPLVYMPTRLLIGGKSSFIIKGEPGSYCSLAVSSKNAGAPDFYGKTLRLGEDIVTQEGLIPSNGILRLDYNLPKSKDSVQSSYYFEVAVWKDKDFKDLQLAKIMSPKGKEITSNEIRSAFPVDNSGSIFFNPAVGGAQDIQKTIETMQQLRANEGINEYYTNDDMPVVLKNMYLEKSRNAGTRN